jgi:osmotically-inducible protein OsmY
MSADEPDQYLQAHVCEALAADDRTDELGVEVTVVGRTVILAGTVLTEARRLAAARVAAEAVPGHVVRNELTVADLSEPPEPERLS